MTTAIQYKRIAWVHTPWGWQLFPGPWDNADLVADGQATQLQDIEICLN